MFHHRSWHGRKYACNPAKKYKKTNKLKKKHKQAKTKVHNGKKVKYFNCLFKFEKVAERALLYITITVYLFGLQ